MIEKSITTNICFSWAGGKHIGGCTGVFSDSAHPYDIQFDF